jgi:hypothetical protein
LVERTINLIKFLSKVKAEKIIKIKKKNHGNKRNL